MKILHLISSIDDLASGTTTAVSEMCKSQWQAGIDSNLFSVGSGIHSWTDSRIERFRLTGPPRKLGISQGMLRRMHLISGNASDTIIMHAHSIWTMQGYYPYRVRRKHANSRFIITPHGTLSPYSLSIGSRLKPIYWTLLQKPALQSADCIHVTSESEYKDVRNLGLRNPIAIIPNGITFPRNIVRHPQDSRTLLYLGRIHPEKGLEALIESWKIVQPKIGGWTLKIVGPDPVGYKERLISKIAASQTKNIVFEPAALGDSKYKHFEQAEILILPSPSENFGMVIAEALSVSVPIISTTGTPWGEVLQRKAGWYCQTDPHSLALSIEDAAKTSVETRRVMGNNGRKWMEECFEINDVTRQMRLTYEWIAGKGPKPSCVELC